MTPAFANEKLVIDLKHVLEDIDALTTMDGDIPYYVLNTLADLRKDILTFPWGYEAQEELEEDRERARQGALAEAAEIAKEIEIK